MRSTPRYIIAVVGWLVVASSSHAAPKADLWERWTAHDSTSTAVIDHAAWSRLLQTYLHDSDSGVNLFAYAEVTQADRQVLEGYLKRLTATPISTYNRDQQLAYWINLYNALTVDLVLEHYPIESITDIDISPGWFSFGPWDKKLVTVEGELLSLNDIEHRILRPGWRDPRIHYAVNCASIGCPNLRSSAFTAKDTDAMLTRGAREYVNHPRGVAIVDGELVVSSIYEWFKEDFGGTDRGVIEHLKQYAAPELARSLNEHDRIGDDRYDWSLNGYSKAAAKARWMIDRIPVRVPSETSRSPPTNQVSSTLPGLRVFDSRSALGPW